MTYKTLISKIHKQLMQPNIKKHNPIKKWVDFSKDTKMEVVTDFLFLGSKLTADSYYKHEIRR